MPVRKEWTDPIMVAQDPDAWPTVRVVRSRVDPAWTRVEQPWSNDMEAASPWVACSSRVAGLRHAVRGLERIVIAQADRIAVLESDATCSRADVLSALSALSGRLSHDEVALEEIDAVSRYLGLIKDDEEETDAD